MMPSSSSAVARRINQLALFLHRSCATPQRLRSPSHTCQTFTSTLKNWQATTQLSSVMAVDGRGTQSPKQIPHFLSDDYRNTKGNHPSNHAPSTLLSHLSPPPHPSPCSHSMYTFTYGRSRCLNGSYRVCEARFSSNNVSASCSTLDEASSEARGGS